MDDEGQPGLALRVRRGTRTISAQHRQLDAFHALVATALGRGEVATARAAFTRFGDALEAHLALEDGLYFPALRGLRPALSDALARLEDEHQALREQLARVADALEREPCERCAQRFDRLGDELAGHEQREEGLLAALRPGGGADPAG